jgi:hypothetical protein
MNTLLNQLLLTYANYDRPMNRFQMLKMPGSTFRHVLEGSQDETVAEAGRLAGSDVPKTFILAKWGRLTKENSLNYLKTMSTYAKLFDYSEVLNEGTLSVTLSHNFGAKGTVFLLAYVKAMFALVDIQPKFSPDENAVVFELR